jgi:DNA recombination protein RmuC
MNDVILTLGDFTLTAMNLLFIALILCALLFFVLIIMLAKGNRTQDTLQDITQLQAELTGRMQTFAEVFGSRQNDLARHLNERLDGVSHRLGENLERTSKAQMDNLSKLNERLAVIDNAQKSIADLSQNVSSLKEILANKQARGAFGQGRMEALLMDALPKNAFTLQPTLSNNKRPDALIHLPHDERGLVVDAKFPLENVTHWREAKTSEEKRSAATRLKNDFNHHIKDIAEKYFLPGETQDVALLFIPSEGLYGDIHEHFEEIVQRAYRANIIIVSPSLLMLAIQVMQSLLRDEQMREQAHLIRKEVGFLSDDLRRLNERVLNLQKHFGQANEDISQILISNDKLTKRARTMETLEFNESKPEPVVARLLRNVA